MADERTRDDGSTAPGRPGVLLDVDGTLLDSNYLHVVAWWRAFRDHRHDGVTAAQVHAAVGLASAALVEHLVGDVGDPAVEAVVAGRSERFEELRHLVTALPGATDLLRACTARGAAAVLTTNGAAGDLEWMLPLLGEDLVTGVVTSDDVDAAKPAPDLLGVALERHGLDPGRTVVVGDSTWDVQAASRAGLPCVALRCGGVDEPTLREAGAVGVRDHPADLLEHLDDLDRALGG